MACIHGYNITPKFIMVILAYAQRNKASRINLEAFTLVQPLNGVGVRMSRGFELELLHHA